MIKAATWVDKKDIEIFMENGCTKEEAIRHLNKGSMAIPVDDWQLYIEQFDDINIDDYSINNIKARKLEDHYLVEHNGKEYILVYVL